MIILNYKGEDRLEFKMTQHPITNPQESPSPTGKFLSDLDPNDPKYKLQKAEILNHPNYSMSETVALKPGINKYENEEHAEYLYKILGNPEVGGVVVFADGEREPIKNRNILFEVDEKGAEIRDHFYKKYRMPIRMAHIRN